MQNNFSIISSFDSDAPFFTEFRRLILKIKNCSIDSEIKTLMVTSAILSEGKSTISALMSLTAAKENGLKTLLLDADLRKPSIHKLFGISREKGLSDVLTEGFDPKDAVKKTEIDKLDIITSGSYVKNPANVFDAEAISFMLDGMKFYYDIIIIDTPPVLPVSDPLLLSSKVDAIAYVIKAGSTSRDVVSRGLDILSTSKHKIIGTILNNSNSSLPYFYDYRYIGYHYESDKPLSKPSIINPEKKMRKKNKNNSDSQPAAQSIMKRTDNI